MSFTRFSLRYAFYFSLLTFLILATFHPTIITTSKQAVVKRKERHQQYNSLHDEEKDYYKCTMWLSFINFLMFVNYLLLLVGQVLFGGNKGEELHRV